MVSDIENFKSSKIDTFFSVNDSVTTDFFWDLRPKFHFLIDPFYFVNPDNDRVIALRDGLLRADWDIKLVVPIHFKNKAMKIYKGVTMSYVPLNELRGRSILERAMFKHKFGMPRAQNVLIAALSYGIWSNCNTMYLFGASHDWTRFMVVKRGELHLKAHHYFDSYSKNNDSKPWVDAYGNCLTVADALQKLSQMFRSYEWLAGYLMMSDCSVKIFNQSQESLIDSLNVLQEKK